MLSTLSELTFDLYNKFEVINMLSPFFWWGQGGTEICIYIYAHATVISTQIELYIIISYKHYKSFSLMVLFIFYSNCNLIHMQCQLYWGMILILLFNSIFHSLFKNNKWFSNEPFCALNFLLLLSYTCWINSPGQIVK